MIKRWGFVVIWLSLCGAAGANTVPLGVYSDLRCIPESGDVVGTQITLMADGQHQNYVLVQWAEGVLSPPQLHKITIQDNQLQWQVDFMGQPMSFSGQVTQEGLQGHWSAPLNQQLHLPAAPSFWQTAYKPCFGGVAND